MKLVRVVAVVVPCPGRRDHEIARLHRRALAVDRAAWEKELEAHGDWFDRLGGTVPEALRLQRRLLLSSLKAVS